MAVARGNTDFVKVLIERFTGAESPDMDGNQLSRKDEAGYTPLDIAKQKGFDEICTPSRGRRRAGNPGPE